MKKQRMLTSEVADILEVSAWVHSFIAGLDQDQERGWAKAICSAEADPMHNQPNTTRYTAQEVMDAIEAYGNHSDFPKRKEFWPYLRTERRKNKRERRLKREERVKGQLAAVTDSTRARNKHHAGRLSEALKRGDLKAIQRIAEEASTK